MIAEYPEFWYGGRVATTMAVDPTRVVQGIVTGIGFLGAGVIVKEGFTISGLNTAASIWAASAIGVMVGVGFYAAAIVLAVLSALCMSAVHRLEQRLPSRSGIAIAVRYQRNFLPSEEALRTVSREHGYEIARGSLSITFRDGSSRVALPCRRPGQAQGRPCRRFGKDDESVQGQLWTRTIVSVLIEKKFGVCVGVTAVGALLAKLDLTPQKPLQRAYQRNPEAIARWQHETYPALARQAKRSAGAVLG